jgi:cell surface protein SprA
LKTDFPPKDENQKVFTSAWGKVPAVNQFINAFDNDLETGKLQDVGLDGLSTQKKNTLTISR